MPLKAKQALKDELDELQAGTKAALQTTRS
jgi:hypothetical protein